MDIENIKKISEIKEEFSAQFHSQLIKKDTIYSGFQDLDAIVNGFQTPSLNYIVSDVYMGKSTLVQSLLLKMTLENKYGTLFFSLEHDAHTLMTKIISFRTHLPCEKIRKGVFNIEEIETITTELKQDEDFPLYLVDSTCLTLSDIKFAISCFPPDLIKVIVIDSIQFLNKNKKDTIGNKNTKKDIEQILKGLKEIAKVFNLVLFVTLPIEIDIKNFKRHPYFYRPNMNHLNSYGSIAKMAESILYLYRPAYYKIEEWDDESGSDTKNEIEITVATKTSGVLGECKLCFNEANEIYESTKR